MAVQTNLWKSSLDANETAHDSQATSMLTQATSYPGNQFPHNPGNHGDSQPAKHYSHHPGDQVCE